MAGNGSQETRNDFMVSDSTSLRVGHFLNPSFSSSANAFPNLPPYAFTYNQDNPGPIQFGVNLKGWQTTYMAWEGWVERMELHHGPMWRNLGIYDAIKNSTLQIIPHEDVVLGLARKWFTETNTFVFKWGEASITIEDLCFLGGFSPLGDSVSQSLNTNTQEIAQVNARLMDARRAIYQTRIKKVPLNHWIELFQGNENGFGDLEHVAFLVFWLSRFVFPKRTDVVGKHVHSIAIRLAMGVRIALAPAVLASIYWDLRILKNAISGEGMINVEIWAPMHLLQIWAWERFPQLKPQSNLIVLDQPIMARWDGCWRPRLEQNNIDSVIESSGPMFSWRPYVSFFENHELTRHMYQDRELIALDCSDLEPKLQALIKFVRPSELVGLGFIEQYFPHRVARQFGFDQDLPGPVSRHNQNNDVAWEDYNRPVGDQMFYIPPKLVRTEVTIRYMSWWNRSKSVVESGPS